MVAGLAATLAAGPWPALGAASLGWRAPLVLAGTVLAWRRLGWRSLALAIPAALAVGVDATLSARHGDAVVASRVSVEVAAMQRGLGAVAEAEPLRHLLSSGGGEAEPEAPFGILEEVAPGLPLRLDALVMIDERGQPIGWVGERSRLPLRLRPLGDRTVSVEPGVGAVWLWWREPVFEAGRPVGALLAGSRLPEEGGRRLLGVWAGRAARALPVLQGGQPIGDPTGARLLGAEVLPDSPALWSAGGLAAMLGAVLLALVVTGREREVLALGSLLAALLLPWPSAAWRAATALAGLAVLARWLPSRWPFRVPAVLALGGLGWVAAGLVGELGVNVVPNDLLAPGLLRFAVMMAATLLLWAIPPAGGRLPGPVRLLCWLPLAMGVLRGDPGLLGIGLAVAFLGGFRGRSAFLAAVAAAMVLVGSEDAARSRELVGRTEATLARLDKAEAPARAVLARPPEAALVALVRLQAGERQVVLGRLAQWLEVEEVLPGASLVLVDPGGSAAATWGDVAQSTLPPASVLAARQLPGGWQLVLRTPAPPHDLVAALGAAGIDGPLAVFDRAGEAVGRGGTFRPLSPGRVGNALAAGRSWGTIGVGEREYRAYLRSRGDVVLAVPWIRRPPAESALAVGALGLWVAIPLVIWERRRRFGAWWARRHTVAGRVQALTVLAAVAPVVVLANLLPQQWTRQRERGRLEVARAIGGPISDTGADRDLSWLVRQRGAIVAIYRGGVLAWCTRPDLASAGVVPLMPPAGAFVRAVRGWREPVLVGSSGTDIFAPTRMAGEPAVVGVLGLRVAGLASGPSPGEWFAVMGVLALLLALGGAERLGERLTGPLSELVEAARRLQKGEPVPELTVGGEEDVAALGRAFLAMAETVQRREEELRNERDLLERVLGTLSAAVVVANQRGAVELANPAGRLLLGESDQVAALTDSFGSEMAALTARAASGQTVRASLRPASEPDAVWQATAQPLTGAVGRVLLVMEDVSVVARAQRLASLAEAARIVAHEVKNPLTPIRLWAEELLAAIERGPQATVDVARTAAEQILERVSHLREVAQGFSNLAALEHWRPESVRLEAVMDELAAEYAVLAQRGVRLDIAAAGDAHVTVDPTWLRRALRHLLENSVRAIGEREGFVTLGVESDGGAITVVARDSGGGVAEAQLDRLFEPHFSTTSGGSGLGLAMVQRIMARAGGHVVARNAEGGLEIRLVFPRT